MSELKRSINKVQINGTLEEMNLKMETKETTITRFINGDRMDKKVTCKVISKSEFKNPSFTVSVNGNTIPIEYFGVNFGVAEKHLTKMVLLLIIKISNHLKQFLINIILKLVEMVKSLQELKLMEHYH